MGNRKAPRQPPAGTCKPAPPPAPPRKRATGNDRNRAEMIREIRLVRLEGLSTQTLAAFVYAIRNDGSRD